MANNLRPTSSINDLRNITSGTTIPTKSGTPTAGGGCMLENFICTGHMYGGNLAELHNLQLETALEH